MTTRRVSGLAILGLLLSSRHAVAQTWTELSRDDETRVLDVRPSKFVSSEVTRTIEVLVAEKAGPVLYTWGADPEKPSFAKTWSTSDDGVQWGRIVDDIDGDARPEVVTWSWIGDTRTLALRPSRTDGRDVIRLEPLEAVAAGATEAVAIPRACVTWTAKESTRTGVLWTTGPERGIRDSALELYDRGGKRIGRLALGRTHHVRLGGLVSLGDVDGDGTTDLAVRRSGESEHGASSVRLVSGEDLHAIWETASPRSGDPGANFGGILASGADVDRDGTLDVAVYSDAIGADVVVLSGRDGAILSTIRNPSEDYAQFGASLQLLPAARTSDPVLLFVGHPDLNTVGWVDVGGVYVVDARKGEILGRLPIPANGPGAELGEFVGVVRDAQYASKLRFVVGSHWRCYGRDGLIVDAPPRPK